MRSGLPVISFLCAVLLAVFIPVRRVRCNVANLAIVSWLVGCNVVHGINALVWAGNVDIHVPVWCDIVTRLLLGATVALPGAFICISRDLELVSSTRHISTGPRYQRNRALMELVLCYVLPIIYMSMHVIVQDYRFDLVEDFGCSASFHPSTPGLIIMWLPPMIICSICFVFSGLAVHNSFRITSAQFFHHLESRSKLTPSLFVRRIATSLFTTGAIFIVTLFSLFSVSDFKPWISWASVHAHVTIISLVATKDEIRSIQLAWWGVPIVSIVYILLSFTIGEEMRDSVKWIKKVMTAKPSPTSDDLLVLPTHNVKVAPQMVSLSSTLNSSSSRPQTPELKSGWDDMLNPKKKPKIWVPGRKSPNFFRAAGPSSPSPTIKTASGEDEAFMASTLDYVTSPTAHTLGIRTPTPLLSPPPVYTSPRKTTYDKLSSPSPSPMPSTSSDSHSIHIVPSPRAVPEDVGSVISSVFDADWPHPPPSAPPSIGRARSRSPVSSEMTFGFPLHPSITPPHMRSKPFQGPGVSSVPDIPSSPSPKPKKGLPKCPSVKSLRRTLSGDKFGGVFGSGEVIYMTVVKETV